MPTWLHFGDLHASADDDWRSLADLRLLIEDANRRLAGAVDFAILPGDNANHGTAEQYARIRAEMDRLAIPWRAIPGDHDFESGSLAAFHEGLGVAPLPRRMSAAGRRALFLDIVSPGGGGPDFRLGPDQTAWLRAELDDSRGDRERPLVFMHAFPGDLAEGTEAVGALFAEAGVACVDTGHTHYNELLNDGRVIYAATRSTGQIEEGPVGFSIAAVDGGVVSWRFKALEQPWPLVLITSPADERLITDVRRRDQVPGPAFQVRAQVFGGDVVTVMVSVDGKSPISMTPDVDAPGVWLGNLSGVGDGHHAVRVEASTEGGVLASDVIRVLVSDAEATSRSPLKAKPGHDIHSLGAWPEHGLLGSQLGPNKNGRAW